MIFLIATQTTALSASVRKAISSLLNFYILNVGKKFFQNLYKWSLLILLIFNHQPMNASNEFREWRNQRGVIIEAKFIDSSDHYVEILMRDGRSYQIPLVTLSQGDQIYVQSRINSETQRAVIDPFGFSNHSLDSETQVSANNHFGVIDYSKSPSEFRSWTNRDGVVIEAKFISAADANVEIQVGDGKTYHVSLISLSEADQKYVQNMINRNF